MRRGLGIAALVVGAFVLGVALTFPTADVLRRVAGRALDSGDLRLAFGDARLRPSGLHLDDLHLTRADGAAAFDAKWLRIRPSLWGLVRGRLGRPWSVGAGTCQGTVDVVIDGDGTTTPVEVEMRDVELAACAPYVFPRLDLYGRVTGSLRVRWPERDPAAGEGAIELRGAAWRPGGVFGDTALHADTGTVRWRLGERRLAVETIEAASSDFRATGRGSVRFVTPQSDSLLDIRITVTPGPTIPPLLRRWFDAVGGAPPDRTGARTFRVGGTLGNPDVVAISASAGR